MVEVKEYRLPPTSRIPNSPFPLLHYPRFFPSPSSRSPTAVHDAFAANGWQVQWIFRYGPTQQSHYHSAAHECMAVLSGEATIRFGVADDERAGGGDGDAGGIEVHARAGDVFVLPAGLAHKTFNPEPSDSTFKLLTPGDGHHHVSEGGDGGSRAGLERVELSGFTMIGAYPVGAKWDFAVGGEHEGRYQEVWSVPRPERDPVLGADPAGLTRLWS
ncbi:fad-dependent pyridine nucleotide-disulfide oxidoreductase [Diaporthe amygdali]|uniref:fad-dependent pyridine nucleotide-disulfide oxidoreductase n=1 Tax=Phomopsis amygdali TaxID=1214568 RepID=UPI0022FEACF2|nr:fad-dependent pyridine nucleotide-disulfide oxidoreductase [Diaporthe amygdali]KAJ0121187.1 fad-dependent pyridine nucleotide-disulfide oxidoreductase [Diaporthe amygdali]